VGRFESGGRALVMMMLKKCCKANRLLENLVVFLTESEMMDHQVRERIWVFLLYVARTYTYLTPFLSGLRLTIDSWRPGWGEEGSMESDEDSERENWKGAEEGASPVLVRAVPRLRDD
jgi:hypothetical protein